MTDGGLRIIVTGLIAQHPTLPGVTWDYVQYPVGLSRLGHDVYYIEDTGEWPYRAEPSASGNWEAADCISNVAHLAQVMARFGLDDHWAYRFPKTGEWFGLSEIRRREVIASADLVLNVSGTIARPLKYRAARRLAFIDTDPVFTQAKLALGSRKFTARVLAHDVHFSFGERHSPAVPATPFRWLPTRQPILLSEWRPSRGRTGRFTTVMSWASYQPLRWNGRLFGQKDIEFRRYLDLPRRVKPASMEVALGEIQHAEWQSDGTEAGSAPVSPAARRSVRQTMNEAGWHVVGAGVACPDLDGYRRYIETSAAEWSVAKHGYVVGQPGWFSCRSACYLAAGKPVVVENTGFDAVLPTGEGLFAFCDIGEAAAAIGEVRADYSRHAAAARDIAATWFAAEKVLPALIERAMAAPRLPPSRRETAHSAAAAAPAATDGGA
jgi:hypothetical protein